MSMRDRFGPKEPTPARVEREDAPPLVRALLLDVLYERARWDDEFDPYDVVCRALGEVPTAAFFSEKQQAVRDAVDRHLDWPEVYDLIAEVSSPDQEERINAVLAKSGMAYEFGQGEFHPYEPEAHELEVAGVESEALAPGLDPQGRFRAPKEQYAKALRFLRAKPSDPHHAIAAALNALEGTVAVISGEKNIAPGVKRLYSGERTALGKSMEMLFVYGSAVDGVRHGARRGSDISEHEATFIVRAAGSAIAYLIAAEYEKTL